MSRVNVTSWVCGDAAVATDASEKTTARSILFYPSRFLTTLEENMNTFDEHHQDSIRFRADTSCGPTG
jgi:hypothetical protein